MPDYDMVFVGSGFAGSAAALSFLEAAERAGRVGRLALIESGKRGAWAGASRWSRPFLRLGRDNTLSRDWFDRAERDSLGLSDLEYSRKLADEVPDTVVFMEDHGVDLIHHDEEDAALGFEEQRFVYPAGGGKEVIDFYLSYVARHETADILWEHEATGLSGQKPRRRTAGIRTGPPGGHAIERISELRFRRALGRRSRRVLGANG